MGFTRNYDMLRMLSMGVNTDCNALQASICHGGWYLKNVNGEISYNKSSTHSAYYKVCYSPFKYWREHNAYSYSVHSESNIIVFGTNGAEETYDDYRVSSFSTQFYTPGSNIDGQNTHGTFSLSEDNTKIYNTVYCSYLNTSGTTQTIREMGITLDNLLLYRKVLETPLIVPVGGYFKISFTYAVPIPESLQTKTEE